MIDVERELTLFLVHLLDDFLLDSNPDGNL